MSWRAGCTSPQTARAPSGGLSSCPGLAFPRQHPDTRHSPHTAWRASRMPASRGVLTHMAPRFGPCQLSKQRNATSAPAGSGSALQTHCPGKEN